MDSKHSGALRRIGTVIAAHAAIGTTRGPLAVRGRLQWGLAVAAAVFTGLALRLFTGSVVRPAVLTVGCIPLCRGLPVRQFRRRFPVLGRLSSIGTAHSAAGAAYTGLPLTIDGNIITGEALGAAIPFALAIARELAGADAAARVKKAIVYQ